MSYGIDISKWQGNFDIAKAIKNYGVEFAIIKAGGSDDGIYTDKKFEDFYKQCKTNNLPCGCYWFANDMTINDAKLSANYLIKLLNNKQFEYPIYYDVEGAMYKKLTKKTLTSIITTFCSILEKAGYFVGIYSSESMFKDKLSDTILNKYTKWVAKWSKSQPSITCDMWQFGGSTNLIKNSKINGVTVDQNYSYKDFTTIIKNNHKNNYKEITVTKKSINTIANEVLAGKWGNGNERITKLTNAGYNYKVVQNAVNKLIEQNNKSKLKPNEEIAKEVIQGKWGNGNARKTALTKAGYDYNKIQTIVNKMLK